MRFIVGFFVILGVVSAGWVYWPEFSAGSNRFRVYPVLCQDGFQGSECAQKITALQTIDFFVDAAGGTVESVEEGGLRHSMADCTITDKKNWTCPMEGVENTMAMKEGRRIGIRTTTGLEIRDVSRTTYRWLFYKNFIQGE